MDGSNYIINCWKVFLPIFIEKGLYTIPEFIEKRFSSNLKTILAIFWIALFVFVNLTTVLFLGAKALDIVIGTGDGSLLLEVLLVLVYLPQPIHFGEAWLL